MPLFDSILARMFPPRPEPLADVRPGGRTTVRGVVVPRDLIESPLTGDRCVYYQYTVEEWRQSRVTGVAGDGFWQMSESDEAIAEFYIHDDSAMAIVAPHRAKVERGKKVVVQTLDLGFNRRAQQLLILPGDEIEVTANVERADDIFDEGRGYRADTRRIILVAPTDERLQITVISRGEAPLTPSDPEAGRFIA